MNCSNTNNTCTNCNYSCNTCNNKCPNCGCKDAFLTTPPPCPTPAGCPDPPACSEVLDSNCVIYTGPGIECGDDTVVFPDTSVMDALDDIVQYFCQFNPLIPEILCGETIVIDADSSIVEAFQQVVDYFCNAITTNITANNGLTMSTSTNVQLGGTLVQNTVITQHTNLLSFTSTPISNTSAFNITASGSSLSTKGLTLIHNGTDNSSIAAYILADKGTGLLLSTNNASVNPALYATANHLTLGNSIETIIRLYASSSVTPIAGIGTAIDFNYETSSGLELYAGKIGYESTTMAGPTLSNESKFFLTTKKAGIVSADNKLEVSGSGQLKLNKYGIGTFTGTPSYNLLTTATGLVIEETAGLFGTAFRAIAAPPRDINAITKNLNNSYLGAGDTVLLSTVQYELVNGVTTTQYNTITGIWTCPQTGKYDLNCNLFLTSTPLTGYGWGNITTDGYFQIGVTNTTGNIIHCADIIFVRKDVFLGAVYGTSTLQGINLTAGTQLVLKVLNFTGTNYLTKAGDNIDWSIRRVG